MTTYSVGSTVELRLEFRPDEPPIVTVTNPAGTVSTPTANAGDLLAATGTLPAGRVYTALVPTTMPGTYRWRAVSTNGAAEGTFDVGGQDTYSDDADVRVALGSLGKVLPTGFDLPAHRGMAFAELQGRLADLYPSGLPAFTIAGTAALRWAEAKLTAASVLEVLRASSADVGDVPAALRRSVEETLSGGIVGSPAGTAPAVDADPATPVVYTGPVWSGQERVVRVRSVFADPYLPVGSGPTFVGTITY